MCVKKVFQQLKVDKSLSLSLLLLLRTGFYRWHHVLLGKRLINGLYLAGTVQFVIDINS